MAKIEMRRGRLPAGKERAQVRKIEGAPVEGDDHLPGGRTGRELVQVAPVTEAPRSFAIEDPDDGRPLGGLYVDESGLLDCMRKDPEMLDLGKGPREERQISFRD